MICIVAAGLTILMSNEYLSRENFPVGEYYPLILFTTAGAMWMASGTDLMTIFLGLEVLSVSLYVLAGFFRDKPASNEAGLKYFFLGAFSTGFLLYGVALLYGVTGTTKIQGIAEFVRITSYNVCYTKLLRSLAGLSLNFAFRKNNSTDNGDKQQYRSDFKRQQKIDKQRFADQFGMAILANDFIRDRAAGR